MNKLGGSILMGVGILIAGLSGLCSVAVAVMGLSSSGLSVDIIMQGLGVIGLFGGLPFAVGLGLFFGGRSIVRRAAIEEAEAANARLDSDDQRS